MINSLFAASSSAAFASFCAIGKQMTLAKIAPYIVVSSATAIAGPVQADAFDANIEDGEDHEGEDWDDDLGGATQRALSQILKLLKNT